MDFDFSTALLYVRNAMVEAGVKSNQKRLNVLQNASCKMGCSGCCRRQINISVAEAVIIQEHLEKSKKWTEVFQRCKDVLKHTKTTNSVSWFRMNIPCPILENDVCLAYNVRPAICSVHFATSDPDICHPWSTKSGEFSPVEFQDIFLDFRKVLSSYVDSHGILSLILPLPMALLMAERVRHQPKLNAESLIRLLYNELA
jgi:Fe-S-cluster containining protein